MKESLSYRDKMRQADKEARATLVVLALTVVVWLALGIGIAGCGLTLFSTPLWIIGGTLGTWVFTIIACVFLVKRVFVNFDLDESEGQDDE